MVKQVATPKNGTSKTNRTSKSAKNRISKRNSKTEIKPPATIIKRDGRIADFDIRRIERAVSNCFAELHSTPSTPVSEIARQVVNIMAAKFSQPTVEEI